MMESSEVEECERINICPICNRDFNTLAGLRQHWTKSHSNKEINSIIEQKTQHQYRQLGQTQTPQPPVDGVNWNKFQVITNDANSPNGKSFHQFDIIENEASGDCLFQALLRFLEINAHIFPDTAPDVHELRSSAVKHITFCDDETGTSNFDRFKFSVMVNLNNERSLEDDTPPATLMNEYKEYMSKPGTYATTSELCAIAEMYNFGFHIIQKDSDDGYTCYDYGSMEPTLPRHPMGTVYLLFTGNVTNGHFRLLLPDP